MQSPHHPAQSLDSPFEMLRGARTQVEREDSTSSHPSIVIVPRSSSLPRADDAAMHNERRLTVAAAAAAWVGQRLNNIPPTHVAHPPNPPVMDRIRQPLRIDTSVTSKLGEHVRAGLLRPPVPIPARVTSPPGWLTAPDSAPDEDMLVLRRQKAAEELAAAPQAKPRQPSPPSVSVYSTVKGRLSFLQPIVSVHPRLSLSALPETHYPGLSRWDREKLFASDASKRSEQRGSHERSSSGTTILSGPLRESRAPSPASKWRRITEWVTKQRERRRRGSSPPSEQGDFPHRAKLRATIQRGTAAVSASETSRAPVAPETVDPNPEPIEPICEQRSGSVPVPHSIASPTNNPNAEPSCPQDPAPISPPRSWRASLGLPFRLEPARRESDTTQTTDSSFSAPAPGWYRFADATPSPPHDPAPPSPETRGVDDIATPTATPPLGNDATPRARVGKRARDSPARPSREGVPDHSPIFRLLGPGGTAI